MIKTTIANGTDGDNLEAKVGKSGKEEENSLWTHISGFSPGFILPVGAGVSGLIYEKRLSLNNAGVDFSINENGSVTNQIYSIGPDTVYDILVTEVIWQFGGAALRINGFMNLGGTLTNGCVLSLKSDNNTFTYTPITNTYQIAYYASLGGFETSFDSSGDVLKCTRIYTPNLIIRKKGYYGANPDDYIQLAVRDNLTSVSSSFNITIRGFLVQSGVY
jgi:hypothetical protein